MTRVVLIIAVIFMTGALLTQSIYAFKLNATQTLVAEEEPHEEKPTSKNSKTDLKDKYCSSLRFSSAKLNTLLNHISSSGYILVSKGYADKPYTPPDNS
ncbi:MAG TPA: hypothetical protein VM368_05940 [Flavisolibacter sp.]|nr:hypothetical protein [Flavisolibacter sp.]